jgi:polyisoprenoid-binding protein YceI
MKDRFCYIAVILFVLIAASSVSAQLKKIEASKKESSITYKLTHPLHEIEATSKESTCRLNVDLVSKQIKSAAVVVDVMTFNSGNSNRDSHAMEVIDAISYPDARFISSNVVQKGDSVKAYGKLTFHGITKDVTLSAAVKWEANKLVIDGWFDISLTEFKVERPSLLLIPVKDILKFTFAQTFYF